MQVAEFHYKVAWRARGSYPGHHASRQQGGGLQFRHHVPLIDAPDPRRFDVFASLRDPFEQIQARVYEQSSAIAVYVIADLSASMQFGGVHSKLSRVADFAACLSYSARRTGDAFGFIGCRDAQSPPIVALPSVHPAAALAVVAQLRARPPLGRHAEGLLAATALLGARRALVFLLSDFHFPDALLTAVLASLAAHDVVPVMLRDLHEYAELPRVGLARVRDPETGQSRLLFMRPGLKQRIAENFLARQRAQSRLLSQAGRPPLLLQDEFRPDEVTRYFFG